MTTKANDMAFPIDAGEGNFASGLTKREYFAAMAMNGLLSVQDLVIDIGKDSTVFKIVSKNAVKYADALIAALNTPEA